MCSLREVEIWLTAVNALLPDSQMGLDCVSSLHIADSLFPAQCDCDFLHRQRKVLQRWQLTRRWQVTTNSIVVSQVQTLPFPACRFLILLRTLIRSEICQFPVHASELELKGISYWWPTEWLINDRLKAPLCLCVGFLTPSYGAREGTCMGKITSNLAEAELPKIHSDVFSPFP